MMASIVATPFFNFFVLIFVVVVAIGVALGVYAAAQMKKFEEKCKE